MLETSLLTILLWWLAAAIVLPFLAAPIYTRLKGSRTFLAYIEERNFHSFPPPIIERFNKVTEQLRQLNFQVATYYYEKGAVPHTTSYGIIFVNEETGDLAIMVASIRSVGGQTHTHNIFQFFTCFPDDTEVVTDTSTPSWVFNRPPKQHMLHLPGFTDLVKLFQIHRRRVSQYATYSKGTLPERGREMAFLFSKLNRNLEYLVTIGFMYKDFDSQCYRYTWKGAFALTLPSLWPVNRVIKQLNGEKVKGLLKS
jgi:hypothetical protein